MLENMYSQVMHRQASDISVRCRAKDVDYTITQNFTRDALSSKTVYTNAYSNDDIMNLSVKKDANGKIITPNVQTVHRLQLAYSEVDANGII